MADVSVIRIKPYHYIHVLDNNTNVTSVVTGPRTYTRQDHEKVVLHPQPMIMVPPRHYCVIHSPVQRDEDGEIITDLNGQAKVSHGDQEIRFEGEPFALYPGESLDGAVRPLVVVENDSALRLQALRDFEEEDGTVRRAGDEWLFLGPATYYPRIEVWTAEVVKASVIKPLEALRLQATKEFTRDGVTRHAGEEWLVRKVGSYLPQVEEVVKERVPAHVLTEKKALHLRALQSFTDVYGVERKAGEEWLVTMSMAEAHIPDVYERVVGEIGITILSSRQYCVVLDPVDAKGKTRLGARELRVGETSFFLRPGERLENGIQMVNVLDSEEALLLRAREAFVEEVDDKKVTRRPGDCWMIYGPCDYVPPVQVKVVEKRRSIPLDENEGVYVRDLKTGRVRAVIGETFMLKPDEELWEKELPEMDEALLNKQLRVREDKAARPLVRDKTRVVVYKAPPNTAVQVYDFKSRSARVVFGPELVMLGPDEQFTSLSLSGDTPKRPHIIKALALMLGPDFMTDIVIVETADHARLSLKLSYNWHFDVDRDDRTSAGKIFSVPDFVGDACKAIASRVRGAVAMHSFDNFHVNSARLIRQAVFGLDENNEIKDEVRFSANNLVITNIDIQSVEPVDQRTRDALQKSVQLAIEITTKSQEAAARHRAERSEQEARGLLQRQQIEDQAEAEAAKRKLLTLQAQSSAVESTGQATAEAQARAEAARIEGEAAVQQAELHAKALKIKAEQELQILVSKQEAEVEHQRALSKLQIEKQKELATIRANLFREQVESIGAETIASIARAGPEMQAKLLKGLGLKSMMITDGNSPINLFNTANGLVGSSIQSSLSNDTNRPEVDESQDSDEEDW